jgi:hypothetical protein
LAYSSFGCGLAANKRCYYKNTFACQKLGKYSWESQ